MEPEHLISPQLGLGMWGTCGCSRAGKICKRRTTHCRVRIWLWENHEILVNWRRKQGAGGAQVGAESYVHGLCCERGKPCLLFSGVQQGVWELRRLCSHEQCCSEALSTLKEVGFLGFVFVGFFFFWCLCLNPDWGSSLHSLAGFYGSAGVGRCCLQTEIRWNKGKCSLVPWKKAESFDGLRHKLKFSLPEKRCSKVCACLWEHSGCCIALVFMFLRWCFFHLFPGVREQCYVCLLDAHVWRYPGVLNECLWISF